MNNNSNNNTNSSYFGMVKSYYTWYFDKTPPKRDINDEDKYFENEKNYYEQLEFQIKVVYD